MRWIDTMVDDHRYVERDVTIVNTQGLHARPIGRFVDLAARFTCSIRIKKGELEVDGKSPMEMMLLEATQGTVLRLVASGEDALSAIDALESLVKSEFGEA